MPDGVYEHFRDGIGKRGRELNQAWRARFEEYRKQYPELGDRLFRMQRRHLPEGWDKDLPTFPADPKGKARARNLRPGAQRLAKNVPWLMGGSADLAPSCKTRLTFEAAGDFSAGTPAAATCTSASASTPWGPSSTGCRCARCGLTARAS